MNEYAPHWEWNDDGDYANGLPRLTLAYGAWRAVVSRAEIQAHPDHPVLWPWNLRGPVDAGGIARSAEAAMLAVESELDDWKSPDAR